MRIVAAVSTSDFRVAFAPGVTVDKWAAAWPEWVRSVRLDLVPLETAAIVAALRAGEVDMGFVRLPVERDGLHLIPLYDDVAVVVAPKDHPIAAYAEVPLDDLAGELMLDADLPAATAVETVAAGTGLVIVPMSLARLHHRKDVVHRPVVGAEPSRVGLAWRTDAEGRLHEIFVGIVRGRSPRSSRR